MSPSNSSRGRSAAKKDAVEDFSRQQLGTASYYGHHEILGRQDDYDCRRHNAKRPHAASAGKD
jgi:hypothetical protein